MKYKISVSRDTAGLGKILTGFYIKLAVRKALVSEGINRKCYISVLLTDRDGIKTLNTEHRGIEKETDVLSFPMNDLIPGSFNGDMCETDPGTGRILLGDMVISVPKCIEQGNEFGHGYKRELKYLAVHSVLHLLGYDHVDDGIMKTQMRKREKEIMGDE